MIPEYEFHTRLLFYCQWGWLLLSWWTVLNCFLLCFSSHVYFIHLWSLGRNQNTVRQLFRIKLVFQEWRSKHSRAKEWQESFKGMAFLSRSGPSHVHCCVIWSTCNPFVSLRTHSPLLCRPGRVFLLCVDILATLISMCIAGCLSMCIYVSQRKLPVLVTCNWLVTTLRSSSLAVLHRRLLLDKCLWSTFTDQELPGRTSCPAAQFRGQRYSPAVAQEEDNQQDNTFSWWFSGRAEIENGMFVLEIPTWEVWFIANSLGATSGVKQCWDYGWQIWTLCTFYKFHYDGLKKTLNNRAFSPSLLSHVKQGQTALYLKFSFFARFIVQKIKSRISRCINQPSQWWHKAGSKEERWEKCFPTVLKFKQAGEFCNMDVLMFVCVLGLFFFLSPFFCSTLPD